METRKLSSILILVAAMALPTAACDDSDNGDDDWIGGTSSADEDEGGSEFDGGTDEGGDDDDAGDDLEYDELEGSIGVPSSDREPERRASERTDITAATARPSRGSATMRSEWKR